MSKESQPIETMRDAAVRVAVGIPQRVAAKLAGVAVPTLSLYEIDPLSVRTVAKREACAQLYRELRWILSRQWLTAGHGQKVEA